MCLAERHKPCGIFLYKSPRFSHWCFLWQDWASLVALLPANAGDTGDLGLIPGLGRSPGEENGNPLQYSCLGNPTDRGAWRATVQGVTGLDMTEWLNNNNNGRTAQGPWRERGAPNFTHPCSTWSLRPFILEQGGCFYYKVLIRWWVVSVK